MLDQSPEAAVRSLNLSLVECLVRSKLFERTGILSVYLKGAVELATVLLVTHNLALEGGNFTLELLCDRMLVQVSLDAGVLLAVIFWFLDLLDNLVLSVLLEVSSADLWVHTTFFTWSDPSCGVDLTLRDRLLPLIPSVGAEERHNLVPGVGVGVSDNIGDDVPFRQIVICNSVLDSRDIVGQVLLVFKSSLHIIKDLLKLVNLLLFADLEWEHVVSHNAVPSGAELSCTLRHELEGVHHAGLLGFLGELLLEHVFEGGGTHAISAELNAVNSIED